MNDWPDETAEKPDDWKDAEEVGDELTRMTAERDAWRNNAIGTRNLCNWLSAGGALIAVLSAFFGQATIANYREMLHREQEAHTREIAEHNATLAKYGFTLEAERIARERAYELDLEAQVYRDELELTKQGVPFQRIPGTLKLDRKPFQFKPFQFRPDVPAPAPKVD